MQLWFVIGGATVSIVGFYVLMYIAAGFEVDEENVSQAALELKRWVAIAKTQIGLYQVLTQLEFTLAMEFPPTFSKIVEAMKILNEIECDHAGVVTRVLVQDGESVEYGQPLFEIE